jgi:maltose-binding protein MalE
MYDAAPSWRLLNILDYNRGYDLGLDIGVSKMPQLGGVEETYWATYWGLTVAKDTKYTNQAWDFIKFLTEEAQLKTLDTTVKANGRQLGIIYPRISMSSLISQNDLLNLMLNLFKSSVLDMVDGQNEMFLQRP